MSISSKEHFKHFFFFYFFLLKRLWQSKYSRSIICVSLTLQTTKTCRFVRFKSIIYLERINRNKRTPINLMDFYVDLDILVLNS